MDSDLYLRQKKKKILLILVPAIYAKGLYLFIRSLDSKLLIETLPVHLTAYLLGQIALKARGWEGLGAEISEDLQNSKALKRSINISSKAWQASNKLLLILLGSISFSLFNLYNPIRLQTIYNLHLIR